MSDGWIIADAKGKEIWERDEWSPIPEHHFLAVVYTDEAGARQLANRLQEIYPERQVIVMPSLPLPAPQSGQPDTVDS